jgi:uncharacterized RmlC-like cupin family protein
MWYGDGLEQHLMDRAGEFLCIPAGMPHLPYNSSAAEYCVAVIARTDPNEQESVVLMPELDGIHPWSLKCEEVYLRAVRTAGSGS